MTKLIDELRDDDCRYIVGSHPHTYCAEPVHKRSFCKLHYEKCYVKGTATRTGRMPFALPVDKIAPRKDEGDVIPEVVDVVTPAR
jgi:hypothetical protein